MATTDFYASSLDGRRAWHANFAAQIGAFAAKYNLTPVQTANVTNDNAWIQYWVQAKHDAEDLRQQLTKYFNDIAGNNPSLDPPLPINFVLTGAVPGEVAPGIEFRTREIARQIKNHSAYAEADGVLLGIVAVSSSPAAGDVKPTIEAFAAKNGYLVSVVVSNRGESDQTAGQGQTRRHDRLDTNRNRHGEIDRFYLFACNSASARPARRPRSTAQSQRKLRPAVGHRSGDSQSVSC